MKDLERYIRKALQRELARYDLEAPQGVRDEFVDLVKKAAMQTNVRILNTTVEKDRIVFDLAMDAPPKWITIKADFKVE